VGNARFDGLPQVPRSMALSAGVADYQKHRVKKLKKQGQT
jgi:hypothetical protein